MTDAALTRVLRSLEDSLPDLIERGCSRIYRELSSYSHVDRDALSASIGRNMRISVDGLSHGGTPPAESLDAAAHTARERFIAGVSIEQLILAFRISISDIHDAFITTSAGILEVDDVVRGSQILWGISDAFVVRAVNTYNDLALQDAVTRVEHRNQAVHSLLMGETLTERQQRVLGVCLHAPYAGVFAWPASDDLRRHLQETGGTSAAPAVVIHHDDYCVGVVSRRPAPFSGAAIGVGALDSLSRLPSSVAEAKNCLETQRYLGRTGVADIHDLGWRLALASSERVTALYRERFIFPVQSLGSFGSDILSTLRLWMTMNRSLSRTAAAGNLHVNTVRYRLDRFVEITGFSPDNPDDVVGLTWALETHTG